MKKLIVLLIVLTCSTAYSETYTVRPAYPDFNPGDGFMEEGSYVNPLIIEDDHGRPVGELRPSFIDMTPNDGFLDAGSYANPYEIEVY